MRTLGFTVFYRNRGRRERVECMRFFWLFSNEISLLWLLLKNHIFLRVSMAGHLWVSLNILENVWRNLIWIYLIILHNRQAFKDVMRSKYARVLNMSWLYMQGLNVVLNMAQYTSIIPDYASTCLNMFLVMLKYCWMSLNMPQ